MTEEKGLLVALADFFDKSAEAVEEWTGKPADGLRKTAKVARKAVGAAHEANDVAQKAKRVVSKVAPVAQEVAKHIRIKRYE